MGVIELHPKATLSTQEAPQAHPAAAKGAALLRARLLPVVQLGLRRLTGRKSPFQMTLSLTNRCNFACTYCHIPQNRKAELSAAEWCRAIDELQAGGMGRASLIGGEPLLRKDIGEIIRHLRSRGVHAAMNTNGWHVPDRIEDAALLDLVCITLDGPPEVHDSQRHQGSYHRALRAIEALRSRGVPVVTMTVVTSKGSGHVRHVLEVARAMGCKAFFQLQHDADVDVALPIAPELSDEHITGLAHELLRLKREGWPVGNSRPVLEQQARGRYIGACADCHAGSYYGYIFSDGTVAPCLLTHAQAPFENGPRAGFLRAFEALEQPRGPGCSCVPTHEVNHVLDFDVRVVFSALALALASR